MRDLARKRRLVLVLVLANLAAAWLWRGDDLLDPGLAGPGGVRLARARAQARALACGKRDYEFESSWSPPLAAHP